MNSTRDVSSTNSSSAPSSPTPRSTPSQTTNPWSGSDFQAAMNRLTGERREPDPAARQAGVPSRIQAGRPNVGQEEDEDDGKEGGSGHAGHMPKAETQSDATTDAKDQGRLEGVFSQGLPPLPAAFSFEQPAVAGGADLEAFAAAMEKAWVNAGGESGKQVSLKFLDGLSPLSGLGVQRLANGTLSLQLSAHANAMATPELSRTLEALKKRMEARGLQISEVTLNEDDGELERLIPKVR
jgi:hypothetical protein